MNINYISRGCEIDVTDDLDNVYTRPNCSNINEILKQENIIETINNYIQNKSLIQANYISKENDSTWKKNIMIVLYSLEALILLVLLILRPNTTLGITKILNFNSLTNFLLTFFIINFPVITIIYHHMKSIKYQNKVTIIDKQIKYLTNELTKAKEKYQIICHKSEVFEGTYSTQITPIDDNWYEIKILDDKTKIYEYLLSCKKSLEDYLTKGHLPSYLNPSILTNKDMDIIKEEPKKLIKAMYKKSN